MAVCRRDPADRLAKQHVAIGRGQRLVGGDGDLELARAGLGLELVDQQPLVFAGGDEREGEVLDLEQARGAEGRPGAQPTLAWQQRELDLKRHPKAQPALRCGGLHRAQKRALTGRGRLAVLVDLIDRRPGQALVATQPHRRGEVGHQAHVAGGILESLSPGKVGRVVIDGEDPHQARDPDSVLGDGLEPPDRNHLEAGDARVIDHCEVDEPHPFLLEFGSGGWLGHGASFLVSWSRLAITPATRPMRSGIESNDDPLGRAVVVFADGAEAVEGRDAQVGGPACVRHAAGRDFDHR